jgi:hypothetical protein
MVAVAEDMSVSRAPIAIGQKIGAPPGGTAS